MTWFQWWIRFDSWYGDLTGPGIVYQWQRQLLTLTFIQGHCVARVTLINYVAPKTSNAFLSSFTAVGTSSKFNAEIAHLACF